MNSIGWPLNPESPGSCLENIPIWQPFKDQTTNIDFKWDQRIFF